ncbi:glycosyltransferase [Algoriphagus formosus]|uniref:glycosyltransferase n=1 Tax=Algoriphagus formosus TaxID=2007308 RepID=UPI0012FE636C|nr:glycosyltransferase [Algoriphagus formosus]
MKIYSKTVVSVCVITYNQESYILDTIKGIVAQVGDFHMEVIISDDCSTDNTLNVIHDFFENFQKRNVTVQVVSQTKNLGSTRNFFKTLNLANGEYLAICEGDDYWTDNSKLLKQIDVLEANTDCSFCFHKAKILRNGKFDEKSYPEFFKKNVLNLQEFFELDSIPTCSIFFRKVDLTFFESIEHSHGDFLLFCRLCELGKPYYLNEVMSVYRKHPGGVSFLFSSEVYLKKRIEELKTESNFFNNKNVIEQIKISRMKLQYRFFKNYGRNLNIKSKSYQVFNLFTNKYFLLYYLKNKFNL